MRAVRRSELLDLAAYERSRGEIRAAVMEEKRKRRVHVAGVLTFLFENTATMRYQVQEMIRAERMTREPEILHELETYNELLGGEGELGCSLLIEVPDPAERDQKLRDWLGLPGRLYVKVDDGTKVRARFDARQVGTDRLSSVQYLKFDVGGRTPVAVGSDLPALTAETALDAEQRAALAADLAADAGRPADRAAVAARARRRVGPGGSRALSRAGSRRCGATRLVPRARGCPGRRPPLRVGERRALARTEVEMRRTAKISRAQVLALPRPQPVVGAEWLAAAVALALLLAGLML